ncbi:MAG TPA: ATP-binding protein [Terriglobales bacterium]|nr:ATP-binding protein [Terriglobales bacterium]
MIASSKARILVVDDDAAVLLTTKAILQLENYEVEGIGDGAAALDVIRQRHFDLVLTDLKMPEVDGLAVLAEVRKCSPMTVTVMMTGYGSVDSALEAVRLGAYEYLLKPIEVDELKQAVRRSLERKRLSEIDTLYRVSGTVTQSHDVRVIASEVSAAARGVLGVRQVSLLTRSYGKWQEGSESLCQALEEPALLHVLERGSVITERDEVAPLAHWAEHAGARSYALVPGVVNERLVCVLCADNAGEAYDFHASAQRFLQALACQAAMAVENATLIAELQRNNEELGAANEKLRQLDKLKSNFLSIATHELRTPLSVILGYNAMLAESLEDRLDAAEKETMVESIAACKRLIRLVNSMLDISQIESGKMKMNFAATDLRQLVNGVAALFHQAARAQQIRLGVELPSRIPRVEVDSERIEQVLINLVGNALKFTPAGGNVTIRLRHHVESRTVEIGVQDTGIGIAPQDQVRIFDEFAQVRNDEVHPILSKSADAPTSHRSDGSGLGLAIAKRIVEAHRGQLHLASSPGDGSTFSFTLPIRSRDVGFGSAASA